MNANTRHDALLGQSRRDGNTLRERAMGRQAVDSVLFDFHMTLVRTKSYEQWWEEAAGRTGRTTPPTPAQLHALAHVWDNAGEQDPTSSWDLSADRHRAAFVETLAGQQGDAHIPEDLVESLYGTMAEQWIPSRNSLKLLRGLKERGHTTAIVSNTGVDIRPRLLEMGMTPFIDEVVLSFEVGLVKPDRRIFEHTVNLLACTPSRCLMVGDSPLHDGAAVRVGIPTILVPRSDDGPDLSRVGNLLLV